MVRFPGGCLDDNHRNQRIMKITTIGLFCLGCLVLMSLLIQQNFTCNGYYHEGNGKCYKDVNSGCSQGQKLDFRKKDPTCICETGFSNFAEHSGADDSTTCYQWFTKGFCEGDKILTNNRSEPCQENTCNEGKSLHMSVLINLGVTLTNIVFHLKDLQWTRKFATR